MESKVVLLILVIVGIFILLRVIRGQATRRVLPDAIGGRFG